MLTYRANQPILHDPTGDIRSFRWLCTSCERGAMTYRIGEDIPSPGICACGNDLFVLVAAYNREGRYYPKPQATVIP